MWNLFSSDYNFPYMLQISCQLIDIQFFSIFTEWSHYLKELASCYFQIFVVNHDIVVASKSNSPCLKFACNSWHVLLPIKPFQIIHQSYLVWLVSYWIWKETTNSVKHYCIPQHILFFLFYQNRINEHWIKNFYTKIL